MGSGEPEDAAAVVVVMVGVLGCVCVFFNIFQSVCRLFFNFVALKRLKEMGWLLLCSCSIEKKLLVFETQTFTIDIFGLERERVRNCKLELTTYYNL